MLARTANKPVAGQRAASRKAAVVVRAHAKEGVVSSVAKVAMAGALAATVAFGPADAAKADIAGLTPCGESKAYAKRLKNELKGLNKRLKQVRGDAAIGGGREGAAISRGEKGKPPRWQGVAACCCISRGQLPPAGVRGPA